MVIFDFILRDEKWNSNPEPNKGIVFLYFVGRGTSKRSQPHWSFWYLGHRNNQAALIWRSLGNQCLFWLPFLNHFYFSVRNVSLTFMIFLLFSPCWYWFCVQCNFVSQKKEKEWQRKYLYPSNVTIWRLKLIMFPESWQSPIIHYKDCSLY